MSGLSSAANPYVGPRPLRRGEPLYGRSAALSELFSRLQARRIVVLHSPSGAGKSSLVRAGLIPRLERAKFDVWRPIRVNLDPRGLELPRGVNRYVLSAQLSLEQELPAERQRAPARLAELDLLTYLDTRPRRRARAARPVVLLFDQFEEVLSAGPTELEAKREFFSALGEALDTGRYWALFIIREDYLAAFAPYRDRLPTTMSNTVRLDFLDLEGALEAVVQPALAGGRRFPAAAELVAELAATRVQQLDGSYVREQGVHVEPVQLQVVCRRLWSSLPAELEAIESEHVRELAKVSESLARYYADAVRELAGGSAQIERAVREWVGVKLIVDGVRSQVRQEPARSAGLANELIAGLRDRYIVRSEQRAGANWFELSHDRLIEAVARDNEAWEAENLHALQVQAKLWEAASRAPTLLLRAEALPEAERWARANDGSLTPMEREFLAASRQLRERERARRRRWTALSASAALASAVMAMLALWARRAELEALEAGAEARRARELAELRAEELQLRSWALQARSARSVARHPGEQARGLALALDAFREGELPPEIRAEIDAGILAVTEALHDSYELRGHQANVIALSFSPTGARLASGDRNQRVLLWSTPSAPLEPASDFTHQLELPAGLTHLAYAPDADRDELLVVTEDGKALLWRPLAERARRELLEPGCEVSTGSFSPTGQLLALGCRDGESVILARGGSVEASPRWLSTGVEGSAGVRALSFSRDASSLLAQHDAAAVVVELALDEPRVFGAQVRQSALSPEGARVVTADAEGRVRSWQRDTGALRQELAVGLTQVAWLGFAPDGEQIAATAGDTLYLWTSERDGPLELDGHSSSITSASFSPAGELLATVSFDRSVRLWATDSGQQRAQLDAPNALNRVAFSPASGRLASADIVGREAPMVRLWASEPSVRAARVVDAQAAGAPSVSPDGRLIATPGAGSVGLWSAGEGRLLHRLEQPGVRQLSFSPEGARVLMRSREGWSMWDTERGARLDARLPPEIEAVAFTADPDQLIVADASGRGPRGWSLSRANERPSVQPARARNVIHKLASSRRGMFAAAWRKGRFDLWHADGSLAHSCSEEPELLINDLAFSPSGRWLAVATKRELLWLYDVDRGELHRLADAGELRALAFSPSEEQLIVAADRELSLWELEPLRRVAPIGRHLEPVIALGFTPEGALLSSARPTHIYAWISAVDRRRELACELVRHSPAAHRDALESCL